MNKKLAIIVTFVLLLVLTFSLAACNNEQEVPKYVTPTIGAVYGQTLGDLTLPDGFSWQDPAETSVGEVGANVFKVTFTPSDTEKFKVVKDIDVTVNVSKDTPTPSTIATLSATYGDTLEDITLPAGFTWQEEATTSVGNAGEHVFHVVFTPADTAHFNSVRDIPVTVAVAKASYDMTGVTFPSASYQYDGTAKSLAVAGTLPQGVTVTYEANSLTDTGSVLVVAHFAGETDNYEVITDMTATLTVTKAAAFVDTQNATLSYTYDGAAHGITGLAASGEFAISGGSGTAAGTYPVTVTVEESQNYLAGTITLDLIINKATYDMSDVTFANATYVYDGAAKSLAIAGTLPQGVSVAAYQNNEQTTAGRYNVTVSFAGDADNYNAIPDMTATLIIDKATYDMSGVTFNERTITYGESGYIEIEGTLPDGVSVSYENNGNMDAGTYEVIAHFAGDSANYNVIPDMTATLTINKAAAWYTLGIIDFRYDGQAHSFVPFRATGEVTYTSTNSFVHAGTYTVTFTIAGDKNHYESSCSHDVTISKAPLHIRANDLTVSYGDTPDYTVSYAIFCGSDDSSVLGGELEFTSDYTAGSPIGSYEVTVGGLTSNDYDIVYHKGTLTVEKKDVRIVADDKTITYGDALPELTYTATGFVGNDTPASVIPNFKIKCSSYEVGNTPGYYQISVIAPNTTATPNYHITTVDGFLRVVKAAAGVSITSTTEGMSVDFGTEVPDVTYSKVSTSDSVTIEYKAADASDDAYTTEKPTHAGNYIVRVSVAANDCYEAGNATLAFTVNKVEDPEADDVETPSQRTATYGDLLSSVELPEGWLWAEEEGTLVGDATGDDTRTFSAKYVQTDYADIFRNVEVKVNKADWTAPESIIYTDYYPNKTLKSVPLPEHWYWVTDKDTALPTPSSGSDYLTVQARTDGDDNHNSHTETVFVSMRKGTPQVTIYKDLSKDYDGNPVGGVSSFSASDFSFSPAYDGSASISLKFKKASEPDSAYVNTAPTEPGQYVCKLILAATEWHNEAYATKEFEIRRITASTGEFWFGQSEYTRFIGEFDEYASRPTYVMPYRLSGVGCEDDITIYHKPQGADNSLYTTDLPMQVGTYDVKAVLENAHYLPSTVYCTLTLTGGVPVFVYQDTENNVTYSFNAQSADEDPTICLLYDGIHTAAELADLGVTESYYLDYDCDFDSALWVSPDKDAQYDTERRIYFDFDKDAGTIVPFSLGEVKYLFCKESHFLKSVGYTTFVFAVKNGSRVVFSFEEEYRTVDEIPNRGWYLEGTWKIKDDEITFFPLSGSKEYYKVSEDPEDIMLRIDYGELFALITMTFTPDSALRGGKEPDPISETYAFFKQHGQRNLYIFEGAITLKDILDGATALTSEPFMWAYDEDAEILAVGHGGLRGARMSWYCSFYKEGDEWVPVGSAGEWGEFADVCHYTYLYWLDENEDWHTTTYVFINVESGRYYYYFVTEGMAPLSYAEIVAILTDKNSVVGEDYFCGEEWAYNDSNHTIEFGVGGTTFYLDSYDFGVGPVGDWFHFSYNGEDYFLFSQTPSGGNANAFDGKEYTAKQLAHMELELLDHYGIIDPYDYVYWVWTGYHSDTLVFDIDDLQIELAIDGHETTVCTGTPLYVYHDVKGNATYSFNSMDARDNIDRCFVYDGIYDMDELEGSIPSKFYFASCAQNTVVWISETADPDFDEMVIFDLDRDTGVIEPHDLGEVRYLAYDEVIVDMDENDMPITQTYTLSFNFVEDDDKDSYYVFQYEGKYDTAEELPIIAYWAGDWSQNDNKITLEPRYNAPKYFKTNENSIVLSMDYGDLYALIPMPGAPSTMTIGLFTQDGERICFMFTDPVTEETLYDVKATPLPINWFYEEDAKMIAWGAHQENWSYTLYLDGDEWKPISSDSERICYYTYDYRQIANVWYTTTYLFTTVYNSNEKKLYAFNREGRIAPLTYAEITTVLAKENPTEADYYLVEGGWSRMNDQIRTTVGFSWMLNREEIYLSQYGDWFTVTEDDTTYLLTHDGNGWIGDVWTFDPEAYTAKEIAHMNNQFAEDAGIIVLADDLGWIGSGSGIVKFGKADGTPKPYAADETAHTLTPLEEGEPWCIGYFVQDDESFATPITYTLVFRAYTDEIGVVYSAQGEYDWSNIDQAELTLFGEYENTYDNYYCVYNNEFYEAYKVDGNFAILDESNSIGIL